MKAILHGVVIAESDNVRAVGGYTYFPREAVKMDLLAKSPRVGSDLDCPHGVQFYDVTVAAAEAKRAAWSYEAPKPSMRQVDHWIGFWEDVKVA
jgi:uncharacterized protein (DUF427 family)